jgi:hypothetical protein
LGLSFEGARARTHTLLAAAAAAAAYFYETLQVIENEMGLPKLVSLLAK